MNDHHDRRLIRLIHGELAADEARGLERQIAEDPRLADRYQRLAAAWNDLETPASASAPADFMAGVVAAARRQGSGLADGKLSWSLAPAWARAGSLAALVLGVVLGTSVGVDTGNGISGPELTGDQEAYLLLAEPASLAESFWLTVEETEGRFDNGSEGGERVQ